MQLDDIFSFFESRTNLEKGLPPGNPGRVYRLDRMKALCEAFDHPQKAFDCIHVAGSKGKGSTSAYIAALEASLGRKTGIYSSPHLVNYRERFRIEGLMFPEETAGRAARKLMDGLDDAEAALSEGRATTFELLTLFGFMFFREAGCDMVVLETGLGGRLDATNVIPAPKAAVLTPIEKEHTEILGSRISQIAREKAGILKEGSRAWVSAQPAMASWVFRKRCRQLGIPLHPLSSRLKKITQAPEHLSQKGQFQWVLHWKDGRTDTLSLTMGGRVQAENAALALCAVRRLENRPGLTAAPLADVRLPGRFERLGLNPPIIIDGAHTPKSAAAAAESFTAVTGPAARNRPILIFGSAAGKNHKEMASVLTAPKGPFSEVIVSTPGTFKPSNPPEVAAAFRQAGAEVFLIPSPEEALQEALKRSLTEPEGRPILVTGSFHMAGAIANAYQVTGLRAGSLDVHTYR